MLEISDLTFPIARGVQFEKLSATIPVGSRIALLGGHQSGKETLSALLTGQRSLPTYAGSIELHTIPCSRDPEYLEHCFYIPEKPGFPHIRFHYYVDMLEKIYPKFHIDTFYAYGEILKIDPERPLHQQSTGLQKKFLLACALASGASLIVCSNLFTHISQVSIEHIEQAISLSKHASCSILFTGTNLPYLGENITHLLALHRGNLLYFLEKKEVEEKFTLLVPAERELLGLNSEEFAWQREREGRVKGGHTEFSLRKRVPEDPALQFPLLLAHYSDIEQDIQKLAEQEKEENKEPEELPAKDAEQKDPEKEL